MTLLSYDKSTVVFRVPAMVIGRCLAFSSEKSGKCVENVFALF